MSNYTRAISNKDDIIDSRDVIVRIAELEDEIEELEGEDFDSSLIDSEDDPAEDERQELAILLSLAQDCQGYTSEWRNGESLIHDYYFESYARQLAEDIGAISGDEKWPNNCIDWSEAADQLKQDYSSVDFDGECYWIRDC